MTSEYATTIVTALIYDGVLYNLYPNDSRWKASETIFGEDDSDYDDDEEEDDEW